MPLSLTGLKQSSLSELENLFCSEREVGIPRGAFRGSYLLRIPGRRARWSRWAEVVGFEKIPFGVDFDSRAWFFFSKTLQLGRFRPVVGESRWRDCSVVRLHYDASRLPGPIRAVLYDEVKPLTNHLCVGIGGINAGRDTGDLFFFALERDRTRR